MYSYLRYYARGFYMLLIVRSVLCPSHVTKSSFLNPSFSVPASSSCISRMHLQRDAMRTSIARRIVQLIPVVGKVFVTHRLDKKLCDLSKRTFEPATIHSHVTLFRQRDSSRWPILKQFWVIVPCVGPLVDFWLKTEDLERVRRITIKVAWRVLGAVGVDMEVDAADGSRVFCFRVDVEVDFGPDAVADGGEREGAERRVGLVFVERNEEMREVGEEECGEDGEGE